MIATEHPDRIAERHFLADKSLVLYLPLWKRGGNQFPSDDVYGHQCTNYGPLWTPRGRQFDGTDDYVDAGGSGALNIIGPITLEGWFRQKDALGAYKALICKNNYNLSGGWNWYRIDSLGGSDALRLSFLNCTTVDANRKVVVGTWIWVDNLWHHLCVTYDNVTVLFYRDGMEDAASSDNLSGSGQVLLPTTSPILLGDRPVNHQYFNGHMGEVRVYNRALSALEIQRNYELTKWRYV